MPSISKHKCKYCSKIYHILYTKLPRDEMRYKENTIKWSLTLELGQKHFIMHLAPKRNASLSAVMQAST